MDAPAAAHRLQVGVPATVEHAHGAAGSAEHARTVAETTQNFITLMDALKLKMHAKDQLHPLLSDLLASYTKVAHGAGAGASRERLLHWCVSADRLIELNKMNASDEVGDAQVREMLFDLEHTYSEWFRSLNGN